MSTVRTHAAHEIYFVSVSLSFIFLVMYGAAFSSDTEVHSAVRRIRWQSLTIEQGEEVRGKIDKMQKCLSEKKFFNRAGEDERKRDRERKSICE